MAPKTKLESELEAMRARMREINEEALNPRLVLTKDDKNVRAPSRGAAAHAPPARSLAEKTKADGRSVYVGNVDYGSTSQELEQLFCGCGRIKRVSIQRNKYDGNPKGFAYIEFVEKESVQLAVACNGRLLRGRPIKVMVKRTNKPGIFTTNRFPSYAGNANNLHNVSNVISSLLAGGGGRYRTFRRPRSSRFHFSRAN